LVSSDKKYVQVKANLASTDSSQTPSIKSFDVDYVLASASSSASINSPSGNNTSGGSSSGGGSNLSVAKLVSSGGNLWINLGIALILTILIFWLLMRRKKIE
jgi:hypothetical protein